MKHPLPTLFASLLCAGLFAQNFTAKNSFIAGNTGADEIRDITTDAQGNIYITGSFTDSVDFDPGPGTYYLTTPLGNKPDAFIQKLDANGNFLWAKSFRGTFNDIESGYRLAVDDTGNVFLLGYFQRNIVIDGYFWSGNANTTSSRPFLIKLDSLGNVKWGMGWQHSSASGTLNGNDLKILGDGNLVIVGLFTGTVDFDPTSIAIVNLTSNGGYDIYVQKLASSGGVLNTISIGGTNNDWGRSVNVLGTDLVISGGFRGTTDFDNSTGVATRTSNGSEDCFILRLDSALNFVYVKTFGGTSMDWISDAKIFDGHIYVTGIFSNSVDFNPSQLGDSTLVSFGSTDVFVSKFNIQGDFIWARQFGGSDEERSYSLSNSLSGAISVTGFFKGFMDADPNSNQSNYLNSSGQNDAFVVQLDTAGFLKGSASFGGSNNDILWCSFSLAQSGIYTGGSFQNTIDIDPTPNTNPVTSNGLEDMLFLELGLCTVQADTLPIVACNQFINPADSTVHTSNGFYTANLLATDGCDSTIVFDVTINNIAPTVTQTIDGLAAQTQAQNPSYQWLDCSTGQPELGATGQTFMPTTNGQYAVIVSSGNCIDTSACFAINNVAIDENDLDNGITVYPNPTTGKLNITSSEKIEKIDVYDLLGREVLTVNYPASEIDISFLQDGVYVMRLQTKKGITVSKVIKR